MDFQLSEEGGEFLRQARLAALHANVHRHDDSIGVTFLDNSDGGNDGRSAHREPCRAGTSPQGTTPPRRPAGLTPTGEQCRSTPFDCAAIKSVEGDNMQNRRTLLTAAGSGAVMSLLSSTRQSIAQATNNTTAPPTDTKTVPTDPFILLLHGIYVPIPSGSGPNLGLSGINLMDGTYSRTRIYPVFGVPDADNEDERESNNVPTTRIGNFYVQLNGSLCAYELPNGAIAMTFLPPPAGAPPGFNAFEPHPDGLGGNYLEGTFELTITDATGIYEQFKGGHNHMVDRLHQLASGRLDEFCFCNISQYPFP
jgi:hypothetical protein